MNGEVLFVESNLTGYNAIALSLAAEQGLRTHFVARDPREYVGMKPDVLSLADSVSVVDTYDVGKLLSFAQQRSVIGMVAVDDYRLIPTAVTAQQLGLPHADVNGLVQTHFKDRARVLTKGIGRTVEHAVFSPDQDEVTSSPIGYPCVVKPVDDSGSTGVRLCHDDRDFAEAVERAREVRRNLRDYLCSPHLLVEEYVPGVEYTAECMWDTVRGRWQLIGYTKKLLGPPPFPVETGAVFPYFFEPEFDRVVEETVYAWLAATGHRHGSAHVEFKVDGDSVALIEINPRLGGDQIRDLIRLTSGVDPIDLYMGLYLGRDVRVERAPRTGRYATSFYKLPARLGRVVSVRAPEGDYEGVVRSNLTTQPMDVTGVRDNDDRLGYVITTADDFDRSIRLAELFMDDVAVEYQS
ncbi:ATP-grasp domain-containing protein [Lentzea fradiae]|uniref:ATP-grasp domain-containing protein n=1 Tax=Lentzea fradiae TaxID=200378 RepID=UPI0015A2D576|nr:ATP-grasp domain-containing protein [Lentzea fradiae]